MKKPLAIELYAGRFGWGKGFVSEGFHVVGFDIAHEEWHTPVPKGCELVLQDVLTLHGSQFKDAAVIVASPPCQFWSRMAMPFKCPWKPQELERRKELSFALWNACWRIQREASETATLERGCRRCGIYHPATTLDGCDFEGHHIPMVVENVCGAQKWVGRATWHYGSFYVWGDVPALIPSARIIKNGSLGGGSWFGLSATNTVLGVNPDGRKIAHDGKQFDGVKVPDRSRPAQGFNMQAIKQQRVNGERNDPRDAGRKQGGEWWHDPESMTRRHSSKSPGRKAASAAIAEIPFELARHIAKVYKP